MNKLFLILLIILCLNNIKLNTQSLSHNTNKQNIINNFKNKSIYQILKNRILKHKLRFKNSNIQTDNIPDIAKLKFNQEYNEIIIPLFSFFRFDQVNWLEKNKSQNIYGKFVFKIVLYKLFEKLSILCDNLEIINKDEIIYELTHQNLRLNDGEPFQANHIYNSKANVQKNYNDRSNINKSNNQNLKNSDQLDQQGDNEITTDNRKKEMINAFIYGRQPRFNIEDNFGYTTVIKQELDNVKLEINDMKSYPYIFTDIKIKMEIQYKIITVKCKYPNQQKENHSIKHQDFKFSYLLLDNSNPKKILDYTREKSRDLIDNQVFFKNYLGQRQLITSNNQIEQQISNYKCPKFDEYQSIYPLVTLLLLQQCTNMFGDEATRISTIGTLQTAYAALAIVSASERVQSGHLTVVDELQVASFYLTIVQVTEMVTIAVWNYKLVKELNASKSVFDDHLQIISMLIQGIILISAQFYVIYYKQRFRIKESIALFDHSKLVYFRFKNEELNSQIEIDDSPLKPIFGSQKIKGEKITNLSIFLYSCLWFIGNIIDKIRFYVSRSNDLITEVSDEEIYSRVFEDQKNYYSYNALNLDKIDIQLNQQRYPIDYNQIKQFDISIDQLLQQDSKWNYYQLNQEKLKEDSQAQLKDRGLKHQSEKIINFEDYVIKVKNFNK